MNDLSFKWYNLYQVLEEYGREVRNKYQDNLISSDRLASGELLNSVEYIVNKDNYSISVSLSLLDYWKYIENGTQPHFPPVDKILEWIRVKPILPQPDSRGKLPTPNQLAYLIGRKISEVGTSGTDDLHRAIEEINNELMEKIEDAIVKDIDAMATVIITEFFREPNL